MAFSRYFKVIAILLSLMIGCSAAAKTKGKIRYVVGGTNAEHQKSGKDWGLAKTGSGVGQKDNFRTGDEAQIIVSLSDGSSLTINERTQVSMEKLLDEDGINHTTVNIINGKVNFDAQKQANGGTIEFKTGIATAAIRGTSGVIGVNSKRKIIAALKTGHLSISLNNREYSITGGQTAMPSGDSIIILNLESSGEAKFFDKIDSLTSNTKLTPEKMIRSAQKLDSIHAEQTKQKKNNISCTTTPLPDTTYTSQLTVKTTCTAGTLVGIFNAPVLSEGKELELTVDWAPEEIGPKNFSLMCYLDSLTRFPCGEVHTFYAGNLDSADQNAKKLLTITTSSPATVCSPASVTIEGTFKADDPNAELYVTHGKYTSKNLAPFSVNGQFSHTIAISDKEKNWNEEKVTVEYKSKIFGNASATLDLDINKTCRSVNLLPPTLSITNFDSLRCIATASVANHEDDIVIFTANVDKAPKKSIRLNERTKSQQFSLTKGSHDYEFIVEDQAGNKHSVKKTLGCYPPLNGASINVVGGETEQIRIPPTPPKQHKTHKSSFYKVLRFSVNGLPNNNPVYIKQIVIAQKGKEKIILRGTSDLQTNHFEKQVELSRGQKTIVNITVFLKSGQTLNASKTYEVH